MADKYKEPQQNTQQNTQQPQHRQLSGLESVMRGSPNDGSFGWDDAGSLVMNLLIGKAAPSALQGMNSQYRQADQRFYKNQQEQQARLRKQQEWDEFYGQVPDDTLQVNQVQSQNPHGLQMHTGGFGDAGSGVYGGEYGTITPQQKMAFALLQMQGQPAKAGGAILQDQMKQGAQFKPNMFTTGVEGNPSQRRNVFFDQNGQLQTAGSPMAQQSGVTINNGGFKPPTGYMFGPDQQSVVPIPGGPIDPKGAANVLKETTAYNADNTVFGGLYSGMDKLDALIGKHGTEVAPTAAKKLMDQTRTDLLMQLKEYYKLGAITGPDADYMDSLIVDPTSIGSVLRSREDMQGNIQELRGMLEGAQKSLAGKYPNADVKQTPKSQGKKPVGKLRPYKVPGR